jgi:hypothetical protein
MKNHIITRPLPDEYPEWFAAEIELVKEDNLVDGLQRSFAISLELLGSLTGEQLQYRYAEGKWTIKEIWQHMLDVERVLTYRAMRYARKDETVLSGFDEKKYADVSLANNRNWNDIIEEYRALRASTFALINSFTPEMLLYKGTAGRSTLSVRAVCHLYLDMYCTISIQ